jgi:hypothetical protein
MSTPVPTVRVRYPLRAVLVLVLAGLFFLAELALLGLFMMPLVPLVPVFITFMVGQACLLSSLVNYVTSLARTESLKPRSAGAKTHREARAPETAQAA